jgi:hypothetical protein
MDTSMIFKFETWMGEMIVVGGILSLTSYVTGNHPIEWIGALAVLCSFGHASVADRLAEKQALKKDMEVSCYKKLFWFYFAKEILWLSYFLLHKTYAAIIGVVIFLLYPIWRKVWRKYHPMSFII